MIRFKIDLSSFNNRLSLMSSLKLLVSEAKTSIKIVKTDDAITLQTVVVYEFYCSFDDVLF